MEGDQCSRCLLGSLTVDEQEGFLLCPNCGFLADEVHLVNNPLGGEGVTVGDHAAGGGAAIMPGSGTSGFRRGTGAAPSSHDRGRREAVDRLKGVASRLMPTGMVQEAVNMFHEVRERKLLRIGSEHYTVDAQIAGVLFTVLRSHNQPMPLSEVASACQASPLVVGRHFRTLASALHMPALFPSATIRAFAMRLAAKLLESLNCDQGPRGQHPFFLEAVAVTELVAKLGVGEGRPPAILAAASLLWVAESGVSKKHLPPKAPFAQVLSAAAGCNVTSVQGARKIIAQKVLQIALLLPMSAHFTEANLLHYFPLVASLVHTLAALRHTAGGLGTSLHTDANAASIQAGREDSTAHPSREDAVPTLSLAVANGGAAEADTRATLPPPPGATRAAFSAALGAVSAPSTVHFGTAGNTRAAAEAAPCAQRSTKAKRRRGSSWGESWGAAPMSDQGDDGSMDLQQQQQMLEESCSKELDEKSKGRYKEQSPISLDEGGGLQGGGTIVSMGSERQNGRQRAAGAGGGSKEDLGGQLMTSMLNQEEAVMGAEGKPEQIEDGGEGAKQRRSQRTRKTPHWTHEMLRW